MPQQGMPTAEEFALWGARELSFEELLSVNGGGNVEGAGPVCGPEPDIPDDPPSTGGSSGDSGSSGGSTESGGSYTGGSYPGGGYTYTPPVQNQEPSAPDSPGAQGQELPNTGGMPSVPQKPDGQAPAEPEPKKGWGEKNKRLV